MTGVAVGSICVDFEFAFFMHTITTVAVQSLLGWTLSGNGTWLFVFLTLDGRKEYAFNIAL